MVTLNDHLLWLVMFKLLCVIIEKRGVKLLGLGQTDFSETLERTKHLRLKTGV